MTDDWQARADGIAARRRAIWLWSPIFLIVGLLAIVGGLIGVGAMRWIGLGFGTIMATWGLVYGTLVYIRTVDEQERDANLWGCYAGMCVYLALFVVHALMTEFGTPLPHADYYIFGIVMVTAMGCSAGGASADAALLRGASP